MEAKSQNHLALLVIDVQQGLFQKSTPVYKAQEFLRNLNMLIEQARAAGIPVIYVQHSSDKVLVKGSEEWQLHPDLLAPNGEPIVHKQHPDAFRETCLAELLHEHNVTRLVIAGMVTHGCVKATCQGALTRGYDVTLVSDCHSSFSSKAADLIDEWNEKLAQQGAKLIPTAEIHFS